MVRTRTGVYWAYKQGVYWAYKQGSTGHLNKGLLGLNKGSY